MRKKETQKKSVSIKGLAISVFIIAAGGLLILGSLYIVHYFRTGWMRADQDNDGLALIEDLDPDGDGKDIFSDPDADNDGRPNMDQAVAYSRSMKWTPYDPLMGKLNDLMGRAGFVVCIDVPVRSYLNAGLSMPQILKESASKNPEWFNISEANHPDSPFFYRRVRNYYDLFLNHPKLEVFKEPRPGDWAFFGRNHIALIVDCGSGEEYTVIEASPFKLRVAASSGQYMSETWGMPTFFGRIAKNQ